MEVTQNLVTRKFQWLWAENETGTVDKKGTWGKVVGFQPFLCHVVALSLAVSSVTALGVSSVRVGQGHALLEPECPQGCVMAPERGRGPWMSLHPLDPSCLA